MSRKDDREVDEAIGRKMCERRKAIGMGQDVLAEALGVCRQQVQKYESGMNSMSARRLVDTASALGVSVMFLLSGVSPAHEREHSVLARFRTVPVKRWARILSGVGGRA